MIHYKKLQTLVCNQEQGKMNDSLEILEENGALAMETYTCEKLYDYFIMAYEAGQENKLQGYIELSDHFYFFTQTEDELLGLIGE